MQQLVINFQPLSILIKRGMTSDDSDPRVRSRVYRYFSARMWNFYLFQYIRPIEFTLIRKLISLKLTKPDCADVVYMLAVPRFSVTQDRTFIRFLIDRSTLTQTSMSKRFSMEV